MSASEESTTLDDFQVLLAHHVTADVEASAIDLGGLKWSHSPTIFNSVTSTLTYSLHRAVNAGQQSLVAWQVERNVEDELGDSDWTVNDDE